MTEGSDRKCKSDCRRYLALDLTLWIYFARSSKVQKWNTKLLKGLYCHANIFQVKVRYVG